MSIAHEVHGSGFPVVLLPWFGIDRTIMAAAFEPVFATTTGWQRHYLDLPGCGDSPPGAPDSDGVLTAVRAWLDEQLGDSPVLLAGCSYGGYLAAGLARRLGTRVAGLLLVTPAVRILDRTLPETEPPDTEPGWLAGVPQHRRHYLDRALGNRTATVAERVAALLEANRVGDQGYLERLRANGYRLSDEDSALRCAGPVGMLTGRDDHIAGYADQLAEPYPRATSVALAAAGHFLPFEQPAMFAHLVRDWLQRCHHARRA